MVKELPCFEPVTASIPILYTTTTPTASLRAVHIFYTVYALPIHRLLLERHQMFAKKTLVSAAEILLKN